MSRTSLAFPPILDRDLVGRKVSLASSTSSGGSSGSPQRRPFAPIDVQVSKGDPDSSLRVMESDLYSVYAVNSFTFGSPVAGPSRTRSSSLSPPSTPVGDHTLRISSSRSHASHQFSVQSATVTRIAQTRHPPSPGRSSHSRVDSDGTMTSSSSSMMFSVGMPMTSNPTTPSQFTSEGDADWNSDSSEDGEEYEISIGSTRYEEDGSASSIRARDSLTPGFSWSANDEDGRYVPPISEEQNPSSRDTASIPESNISPPSDYIQPTLRSQSLRPTLNIETSPNSPESDRLKLDEEEPVTARPVPAFHYPTRILMSSAAAPTTPEEQDFDPDWLKLSGGIVTFDINDNEPSLSPRIPQPIVPIPYTPPETDLPSPPTPGRRRSFFSLWRKESTIFTTTPNIQPTDTFETHAKQWEPHNMGNNRNWVFKRSFAEEQKDMLRHHNSREKRHPERDGGKKAEVWTIPGIEGVFLLKRIFTDGTSYQLVVQYVPPRSSRNQGSGKKPPILLVHRHSKVLAFSLGWVRKDGPQPASAPGPSSSSSFPEPGPSRVDTDVSNQHRKHHTMHLFATRAVQQSYTSTATVRRLEAWGLLDSSSPSSSPNPNSADVDARNATVSAPHVLSPPSQPLIQDRPPLPSPMIPSSTSQHPPSPTFTDESYAEEELDTDSIFGIGRRRKPTSHFEAFATMSASEQLRFRHGAVAAEPPVSPEDDSEGSPEEEKAINRVVWPNSKPQPPPLKKKRVKTSKSAPACLETPSDSDNLNPQSTVSSSSSARSKPKAERFTPFLPPWLTFSAKALTHAPPLTKAEEEKKRMTENMARDFNRVGLFPNQSSNRRSAKTRQTVSATDQVRTTVFDGIPKDALFMLLPLWMGGLEGKTRADVRFLLIWYKIDLSSYPDVDLSNTQPTTSSGLSKLKSRYGVKGRLDEKESDRRQTVSGDTIKSAKSSKSTQSSNTAKTASGTGRRGANEPDPVAEHKPFLVLARLVSYSQLHDSGVRVPDTGLEDLALSTSTDAADGGVHAGGDQLLADYILARCPAAATPPLDSDMAHAKKDLTGGVEFDETCMLRLGLAFDSQPGRNSIEGSSSEGGCTVRLTHIGRSIVEMAWVGALALTEFGAV